MFKHCARHLSAILGVSLAFGALGSHCDEGDPPGEGFLLITVVTPDLRGTPLEDFGGIIVEGARVDVVHRSDCDDPSTEHVITVEDDGGTLLFTSEGDAMPRLVTQLTVPVGCVSQVRFIIDEIQVVLAGETLPARVPSGRQTGIKVQPEEGTDPFVISLNHTTAIRISYDPNEHLVINRGQGVLEKPVLEASVEDSGFATGVVLDEIVLTFNQPRPMRRSPGRSPRAAAS
jgi:hypothetical protein